MSRVGKGEGRGERQMNLVMDYFTNLSRQHSQSGILGKVGGAEQTHLWGGEGGRERQMN